MTETFKALLTGFLFSAVFSCAPAHVTAVKPDILKLYKRVAVVPLVIRVNEQDSNTVKIISSLGSTMIGGKNDPFIDGLLKSMTHGDDINAERFQDSVTETINRNLLDRGFIPVERTRIKEILKEIGFQQTGLVDHEKAVKIGQLSRADALFMGRLSVHAERDLFSRRIDIEFSGSIVSVTEGIVLLSGEGSMKNADLTSPAISRLINRWFRGISPLD